MTSGVLQPHINDLPEPALRGILLTSVQAENLLRYLSACARVCCEWRRVVVESRAYARGLGRGSRRSRILKDVAKAVDTGLHLPRRQVGDTGAATLAAALQAMPRIRFEHLNLDRNKLGPPALVSLAPALKLPWGKRGLRRLIVSDNRELGDAGVATLAAALPRSLEQLSLRETGCGDDGFAALAAALPSLQRLRALDCNGNIAGVRGWSALASALPSLPLEELGGRDTPTEKACVSTWPPSLRRHSAACVLGQSQTPRSSGAKVVMALVEAVSQMRKLTVRLHVPNLFRYDHSFGYHQHGGAANPFAQPYWGYVVVELNTASTPTIS